MKSNFWIVKIQVWCVEGKTIMSRKEFFFNDYMKAHECWDSHTSGDARITADPPERVEFNIWKKD